MTDRTWRGIGMIPGSGWRPVAQHSFQVFEVYPWAAMLRRSPTPVAVSVLDRCRIRTGVVREVHGETATVRCRPLVWDGSAFVPGAETDEVVRWSADGRSLLAGLSTRDQVTLHWDWVCDVITDGQAARLADYEQRQHRAVFPTPA